MDINDYIKIWWKGKAGRNLEDYERFHSRIVSENIPEEDYESFFKALDNTSFNLDKTKTLIPLKNVFNGTKIKDFITKDYFNQCLDVSVKQPANGAGEFLLVSNFKNIKFGSSCDLIIDNARVEVKGVGAKLGDFEAKFKQMNSGLEFAINNHFNEHWDIKNFNVNIMGALLNKILPKHDNIDDIKFLGEALQNTKENDQQITKGFVHLFRKYVRSKKDIDAFKRCICAIHLYNYCKTKNAAYIIFVGETDMVIFKSPTTAETCYNVTNYLKIGSWENGRGGITITLQ